MKKYFIFAAIAAAGLLTSCSSSDDAISEGPGNPIVNQDEPVAIILGATANADVATRGTGSVGDIENTSTNVWAGQHVYVSMFNKGTFWLAGKYEKVVGTGANPTVTYPEIVGGEALYNNQEMRTPNPGESDGADVTELVDATALNPTSGNTYVQHKYYPMTNNFDFWAYHIDDAIAKDANNNPLSPEFYDADGAAIADIAADGANAPVGLRVPFKINGTQDLMVASAWLSDTEADIADGTSKFGVTGNFYSAKAARAGIQPNLAFQHLLTRLQFCIQGGDLASCGWTYDDTTDPNNPAWVAPAADAVFGGVFVKDIKVYSRQSGKMIAAYNYWDDTNAKPERAKSDLISWDYTDSYADGYNAYKTAQAAQTDLPTNVVPFTLMGTKAATAKIYGWEASTQAAYDAAETADANSVDAQYAAADYSATAHDGELVAANEGKIYKFLDCYLKVAKIKGTLGQLPSLYDATVFSSNNAWIAALTNDGNENYAKIFKATATDATHIDQVLVGSPMLVSTEATGYYMEITLAQYLLDKSTPGSDVSLEDGETGATPNKYVIKETTLTKAIPAPSNNEFKQGYSYKVVITAYGYAEVNVKATLVGWKDGGNVPVEME